MPARSGRLEKRIPLAVPLQISSVLDPATAERTTTENVCSLGMRVLTQRARELNERLMISSLIGDLRTLARVVYCQRLPDGRFGVGLQFLGQAVHWSRGSLASAGGWWPARRIFVSSIAQPCENSEHLSTPLRELANPVFACPKALAAPANHPRSFAWP